MYLHAYISGILNSKLCFCTEMTKYIFQCLENKVWCLISIANCRNENNGYPIPNFHYEKRAKMSRGVPYILCQNLSISMLRSFQQCGMCSTYIKAQENHKFEGLRQYMLRCTYLIHEYSENLRMNINVNNVHTCFLVYKIIFLSKSVCSLIRND